MSSIYESDSDSEMDYPIYTNFYSNSPIYPDWHYKFIEIDGRCIETECNLESAFFFSDLHEPKFTKWIKSGFFLDGYQCEAIKTIRKNRDVYDCYFNTILVNGKLYYLRDHLADSVYQVCDIREQLIFFFMNCHYDKFLDRVYERATFYNDKFYVNIEYFGHDICVVIPFQFDDGKFATVDNHISTVSSFLPNDDYTNDDNNLIVVF
jgi:hypothetical protein